MPPVGVARHLPFAPMSRLAALVAVLTAVVGLGATTVEASVPPPSDPATTVPGETVAPATTVVAPATTAGPTATTAPVAERTGAGRVDVAKDDDEGWDLRRIATVVAITVVVLALAGFVYGRVRSSRRPVTSRELATTVSSSSSSKVEETASY